jgi:ketosteroid isomerase-like protein
LQAFYTEAISISEQNVEIVPAAFDAYLRGDEATVRKFAAPEILISLRPDQPDVRDNRGYEGLVRTSAEWLEAWDEHTFEAVRVWDVTDFVLVATRDSGRGKVSGVPMENESLFVFTLSQGKIVRLQIFGSEGEALEAIGLAE